MGYTDKRYLCVCQAGYAGENCEEGKSMPEHCSTNLLYCSSTPSLMNTLAFPKRVQILMN